MENSTLIDSITLGLRQLEARGDIVITSPGVLPLAELLADYVLEAIPSPDFSGSDMSAIKGLLIHLTCGIAYHSEDLPAATGYSLEDYGQIASRLPPPY